MKTLVKHSIFKVMAVVAISIFFFAFIMPQDIKKPGPWEIPEKFQKMSNPYVDDAGLVKVGKMLYSKHCKSCHGSAGLGDGPKSKQLETTCGDFSDADFQSHSDGVLFYQSIIGRDEMPNFEKKITDDEDRWSVINFIRTLKK